MQVDRPSFIAAVINVSRQPDVLAAFYRNIVGIELRDDIKVEMAPHFACELGDSHFAIHPLREESSALPGEIRLVFAVGDVRRFVSRIRALGVEPLYEPRDLGFALVTAIRDPDGRNLEIAQL